MAADYIGVLQVKIYSLTYEGTLNYIKSLILDNKKSYICTAPVHLVMECQKSQKLLKGVNKAALVTPDGMPLVWLLKLYGKKAERVYGPTLMLKTCKMAQDKGYKIYLLGGIKGLSGRLRQKLKESFPGIEIVGNKDTPIRPVPRRETKRLIKKINKSHAQIVFVGMGCPYQEMWMIENRNKLNANILVGVGAAFDFMSGRVRPAPTWMQGIGLEWLFRLSQDPKRLWRRYTITNFLFLYKIFSQINKDFLFKGKFLR